MNWSLISAAILECLQLADIGLTEYSINKLKYSKESKFEERNPLMKNKKIRPIMYSIKIGQPFFFYWMGKYNKRVEKVVTIINGGLSIIVGGVVVNNIYQLRKIKKYRK